MAYQLHSSIDFIFPFFLETLKLNSSFLKQHGDEVFVSTLRLAQSFRLKDKKSIKNRDLDNR